MGFTLPLPEKQKEELQEDQRGGPCSLIDSKRRYEDSIRARPMRFEHFFSPVGGISESGCASSYNLL